MTKDQKSVLIVWTICVTALDIFLIAGTSYLVFWKGQNGAWFILAILLGHTPTYFKAMRKFFELPEKTV